MIFVYSQFHKSSINYLEEFINSANSEKKINKVKVKFFINFNQFIPKKKQFKLFKKLKFEHDFFHQKRPACGKN